MFRQAITTCLFALIFMPLAPTGAASANCGTQLTDITVSEGSTINIHNTACVGETARLNVRYVWVNLDTASLVLAGETPKALAPVFGVEPQIVSTTVGRDVTSILRRFGVRLSHRGEAQSAGERVPGSFAAELYSAGEQHAVRLSHLVVEEVFRNAGGNDLARYLPLEPFPWPNLDSVLQHTSGSRWPGGRYTYATPFNQGVAGLRQDLGRIDEQDGIELALQCVVYTTFIGQKEFARYWDYVDDAVRRLSEKTVSPYRFLPGQYFVGVDPSSFVMRSLRAGHPSYDALEYFGRNNWPDDFLIALGGFYKSDPCGGTPAGFSLAAVPRTPFVLFAVVGSEGTPVTVEQLDFMVDADVLLRTAANHTEAQSIDFASQLRVSAERPLLIPLNIELRYDTSAPPLRAVQDMDFAGDVRRVLERAVPESLGFGNAGWFDDEAARKDWVFSRPAADLPEPQRTEVTRRYIYGRSLQLTHVRLGSETIEVAEAPPAAVVLNYFWESGSCPFVSFLDAAGDVLTRERVLIGASAAALARREVIAVPPGATTVRIEEVEPEISYLSHISVEVDGAHRTAAENIALRPREGLEIELPAGASAVAVRGHYELL